jgi:hypothetical protein
MTGRHQPNETAAAQALSEYLSDNCGTEVGVADLLEGLASLGLKLTEATAGRPNLSFQARDAEWVKGEPSDSVMSSEFETEDEMNLET